jgi:hypothetical protein
MIKILQFPNLSIFILFTNKNINLLMDQFIHKNKFYYDIYFNIPNIDNFGFDHNINYNKKVIILK